MEAASVFVKTLDGRAEVRSRVNRLSSRERTTLIMIDGQRCLAELKRLSPTPGEVEVHLQAFLDAGLITAISPAESVIPACELSTNGSVQAGVEVPSPATVPPVADGSLEHARLYIIAVAQDTLSADADDFIRKLASSGNKQELLDLASHLRGVLNRFANTKEADQFWETVREITPKT